MNLSERLRIIAKIPWVKRIESREPPDRCAAYRWSQMSRKASRNPDLKAQYRCKNTARWEFTDVDKQTEAYCTNHLIHSGLYKNPGEEDRINRWLRRNGYLPGPTPRIEKP